MKAKATLASATLVLSLFVLASATASTEETEASETELRSRRVLRYPEATEQGSSPPVIRLASGGAPLALYFPDQLLDPRGEVHFVTTPDRLALRIAERTAFLEATPRALPGHQALATLTLADGRPLSFTVRVVAEDEPCDVAVDVRTRADAGSSCVEDLQRVRDELAECRESSGERAVALIAGLLIESPVGERAVEQRGVLQRDKQNRVFVEVVDAVRLYQHTYVRVRIENRDGSRRTWVAGEPTLTVVGPGPRRRPLQVVSVFEQRGLETGESTLLVLGLETPQIPTGATLRLALHEADGQRHVVIEDLRI